MRFFLYSGLNRDGIEFDVLQVRSCARGVTAQNAFRMSAPASNMVNLHIQNFYHKLFTISFHFKVMVYGLGGIGMSTMAGNALLMKALMSLRQKVAQGTILTSDYKKILANSNFDNNILHWDKNNPLVQNYAQFIDNVNDPRVLAKSLNLSKIQPQLKMSKELMSATGRILNAARR